LGEFVGYEYGNVKVRLLNRGLKPSEQEVLVPIYFTQKVAENKADLINHKNVLNNINVDNDELDELVKATNE
jgi:hypothetical protein